LYKIPNKKYEYVVEATVILTSSSCLSRSRAHPLTESNAMPKSSWKYISGRVFFFAPRSSPASPCLGIHPSLYRAKTFTTPSPPALTTHRPSWLQTTEHTPSPLIRRWLVISWVQLLVSRLQNLRLASCPAETSSRPSGESDSAEIAAG
jgi:hypothetical protein